MASPTAGDVQPEFFKVFMPEFSSKNMLIPTAFVRRHLRTNPKIAVLKHEGGESSHVGLEKNRENNHLYFTTGWERFTKKYSLQRGDFLLFKLESSSSFHVKIFGANGCTKFRPQSPTSPLKSVSENYSKVEKSGRGANKNREEDDKDNVEFIPKTQKRKRDSSSKSNAVQDREPKMKNPVIEETKTIKKKKKNNKNCKFKTIISSSKVSQYKVFIPRVVHEGIKMNTELVVRCQEDKLWPVGIRPESFDRLSISSGWFQVYKHYDLKPKDQCRFTIVVDQVNTCQEIRVKFIKGRASRKEELVNVAV